MPAFLTPEKHNPPGYKTREHPPAIRCINTKIMRFRVRQIYAISQLITD